MPSWFRKLFAPWRADRDFEDEIELHLSLLEERLIRQGMCPEEAHFAARRQFGNITLLKETKREMSPVSWFDGLRQDARFAWRALRRNPGFTTVAILTLALGVGANTAIFSVVKAVLLDPLPYADSGRLVTIAETAPDDPNAPDLDYTTAVALRHRSHSFERLSGFIDGPGILYDNGTPEMLRGLSVDYDFFDTLGVSMELGRKFLQSEQQPGRRLALIISHDLWVHRFNADPHILGRVFRLSVYQVKVVGVLPRSFKPLLKATSELTPEIYYPLPYNPLGNGGRRQATHLIGRLKPGVTPDQAIAELNELFPQIAHDGMATHLSGARLTLVPLRDRLLGRATLALWLVWGAAGFVLLIVCANVANLLLARATGRGREIAIRTALGASRSRVVRQLLTESLMLAFAGGSVGVLLSLVGTGALASLAPAQIPRAQSAQVDVPVLLFALGVTIMAGMLFGLAPSWRASRVDLTGALKCVNRSGRTHGRFRIALAITETALAFVLAVGAGLMIRTFSQLMSVGPGYEPRNVLTLTTAVISPRYATNRIGYYRDLLDRLRITPGIESAAITSLIPMDYTVRKHFQREDRPAAVADAPFADEFSVSTDYFRVMRIPLKLGRVFTEQDTEATPKVAIINESCARAQFPDGSPIGRHIKLGDREDGAPWLTVVGVVGDVHQDGLDQPADMQVYMALNQGGAISSGAYRLVARTAGDPMRFEPAVRSAFQAVDSGSPVYHIKPLEGYFSGKLGDRMFALALLGLFGVLALVLAGVGIYGVISYSIGLRVPEIGVRMALGAGRGEVLAMILRQVLVIAATGVCLGFATSLVLTRLLARFLFDVRPTDPATFVTVALIVTLMAFAAAAIPARHAAFVDPVTALRSE